MTKFRKIILPRLFFARFLELTLFLALIMYACESIYRHALLNSNFAVILYGTLFFVYSYFRMMPKTKTDIVKSAVIVTAANLLYILLSSYLFKFPARHLSTDVSKAAFQLLFGIVPTFVGTLLVQGILFAYAQVSARRR